MGGAQGGCVVVGVEPALHADFFVRPGDEVVEGAENLLLEVARQQFAPPGVADQRLGAGAVTLGEERAAEREASLGR